MSQAHDVIVIGGGANGLVAATALAKEGRRVLLLERDRKLGGTWAPLEVAPGFSSTLEMEPDWIPPAVAELLGIHDSDFVPAAPTSVRLDDGSLLTLPVEPGTAAEAIQRHSPKDAAKWPAFTSSLRKLSAFLETLYQVPAPDVGSRSLAELSGLLTLGRAYRALGKANMSELLRVLPMPVQDLADDFVHFEPLKAAIAAAGVREIRQGPRSGGTSFVLRHYLVGAPDGAIRGRRPLRGGPGAFIGAAERAARAAGVTLRTDVNVARINVHDDSVAGVTLATGNTIEVKCVVSTADPTSTLLGMIDPVWLDPELVRDARNIRYRGCAAYVCYALDRLPNLPAGVISLSSSTDAIERPYDASKYGEASPRPHVEIMLRPEAKVLIARAQYIPFTLRGGEEWDEGRRRGLGDIVTGIVANAVPGFTGMVRERLVLAPPDLQQRFGVTGGALTHGEMGLDQILFMRPIAGYGRHAMPIAGLYLGGAGTHPGPGIAGGSGLLAARQVLGPKRRRA
jgi:phytoene dehydrogenase-like protein